ncbi:hypothetical protein GN956_G9539 [Arapaima gigas]
MEKEDSSFSSYTDGTELDSMNTENFLGQIYIDEVRETLSKYEKHIQHQYEAFRNMMEQVKKTPTDTSKHMTHFRKLYEKEKSDLSLDVYYWSVIGSGRLFNRPLLKVYLDQSAGRREAMKRSCYYLANLFHIGLSAHMAYIYVTDDTVEEFRNKWALRMTDIGTRMQKAIRSFQTSPFEVSLRCLIAAMADIQEDKEKLKKGVVTVLRCLSTISSAASVVNPIFGVAGSLLRVVLNQVDDEDIKTLKREFASVNRALDEISQQNRNALLQIKKETVDGQYCHVEENLRNQFRKFMEVVEAHPDYQQQKKYDFEQSYANDLGDQNLHTLYDGVMGKPKLFSKPILEVYMKHSHGDRQVMERLCTRLTYLFCIGLIALMGYTAIIEDDEEGLSEEWNEKMQDVQGKMQEVLRRCK